MFIQRIAFKGSLGDTLAGQLDLPASEKPQAYALFAHCFTCSKNYRIVSHIARVLTRANLAVFRFDFTGLGESEGDFSRTTFSSHVADLAAAAEALTAEKEGPKLLIGHSWGGTAALVAARRIASCAAVVTINAPFHPKHVTDRFEAERRQVEQTGSASVPIGGKSITLRKAFFEDVEQFDMESEARSLDRALLIAHAPLDTVVGIENAAELFGAARHPKSFLSLDRGDHLLARKEDAEYAGEVIAAWCQRYL